MELWGITGLIGSGKSELLRILKNMSYPVIDADQLSRVVSDPQSKYFPRIEAAIRGRWGDMPFTEAGHLHRAWLKKQISEDADDRLFLEKLLHPFILEELQAWVAKNHSAALGFVEGTKLIESSFADKLSGIILVEASRPTRLKRFVGRDALTEADFDRISQAQNEVLMKENSQFVLVNDDGVESLRQKVTELLAKL